MPTAAIVARRALHILHMVKSGTVGSADNPAAILLDLEIKRVGANMKLYGQYRMCIESSGHRPES